MGYSHLPPEKKTKRSPGWNFLGKSLIENLLVQNLSVLNILVIFSETHHASADYPRSDPIFNGVSWFP